MTDEERKRALTKRALLTAGGSALLLNLCGALVGGMTGLEVAFCITTLVEVIAGAGYTIACLEERSRL